MYLGKAYKIMKISKYIVAAISGDTILVVMMVVVAKEVVVVREGEIKDRDDTMLKSMRKILLVL